MTGGPADGAADGAVLLITHDRGGGVEQVIRRRIDRAQRAGLRPILLRPLPKPDGAARPRGCLASDADGDAQPYRLPAEWPDLVAWLRSLRPRRIELHHQLGHHPAILSLAERLKLPLDIWVHDYAAFCPRIDLVGVTARYCGEPADVRVCTDCVATLGSALEDSGNVPRLRAHAARAFAAARRIVVPTPDVSRRLRRHFADSGGWHGRIVERPWDDVVRASLPPQPPRPIRLACVIGAIDAAKGRDVLLACARDAAARSLPLGFVLVGFSDDDAALRDTGRVWITGRYDESQRAELIRAQQADLAFLPSIWPETWCFALSHAWEAGLPAAMFDLGSPALRLRAAGAQGGIILPLGLPAAAINDCLLAFSTYS